MNHGEIGIVVLMYKYVFGGIGVWYKHQFVNWKTSQV